MKLSSLIFPRLCVLAASLTEVGWRYTLFHVVMRKGSARIRRRISNFQPSSLKGKKQTDPFALVVTGKTVISKHYPPGSDAANITSRPEEFVFASEACEGGGQKLTFMRAEQYGELLEELTHYKITLIDTRFDGANDIAGETRQAAEEFFTEGLSLKKVFIPSDHSSRVLSLAFSKLLLPVLGAALLVLTVNYFVQDSIRQKYANQTALLNNVRKNTEGDNKRRSGEERFYATVLPAAKLPYSFIADRIAAATPEGIMLTEISVHPLAKNISENKPLEVTTGMVLIKGESTEPAPVSVFNSSLSSPEIAAGTKLRRLERNRDGVYIFEIEIAL